MELASARSLLAALARFHAEGGARLEVVIAHPADDVDRLVSLRAQR